MTEFTSYAQAADHQLREWAEGRPWHNPWDPQTNTMGDPADRRDGECCPDFSCCCPEMIWPREKRYLFVAGDSETRYRMMVGALVNITDPDSVYVAGSET